MMLKTKDGHELFRGDECFVLSFEEDGEYIESSIKCIYGGFWVKDNTQLVASLPPGCSGSFIPTTETMHRFEFADDEDQKFDLLRYEVNNLVITDLSGVATVTKQRLKDN